MIGSTGFRFSVLCCFSAWELPLYLLRSSMVLLERRESPYPQNMRVWTFPCGGQRMKLDKAFMLGVMNLVLILCEAR